MVKVNATDKKTLRKVGSRYNFVNIKNRFLKVSWIFPAKRLEAAGACVSFWIHQPIPLDIWQLWDTFEIQEIYRNVNSIANKRLYQSLYWNCILNVQNIKNKLLLSTDHVLVALWEHNTILDSRIQNENRHRCLFI